MNENHPIASSAAMSVTVGYPDSNPKTAQGALKVPMDLVPPALAKGAAEAFANGAAKYGPYNWREKKISASVYYAAVLRHLQDWWDRIDADDCAPDSKVHHVKHGAACLGMILDVMGSPQFNDNRPPRVNRDGNDTRRQSEGHGQDPAQDAAGVLAHAGAERDGLTVSGLPRLYPNYDHFGDGRAAHRDVRGDRDQGPRKKPDTQADYDRPGY